MKANTGADVSAAVPPERAPIGTNRRRRRQVVLERRSYPKIGKPAARRPGNTRANSRSTAPDCTPLPRRFIVTAIGKLRVAVVGAGRLGGFHAQKLAANPDVHLVAVVDPLEEARRRVAAASGAEPLAQHSLLRGKIDAAIVAAPTQLHYGIAMDLIRAGIHVLVEKPLCPTADEADQLVQAASRQGVVLQVGHVERFNPAFDAVAGWRPWYLEAVRAAPYPFRSMDIGVVLDLMIHDIDLVLALAGSPLRRVDAVAMPVLGPYEDVAQARLEFASGCVANLLASRVHFETVRRLHLWGDEGFAAVDLGNRRATVIRRSVTVRTGQLDVQALAAEPPAVREAVLGQHLPREDHQYAAIDALALEQQDFLESIRLGRAPRVPGQAGREAVAAAEQILQQIAMRRPDGFHPPVHAVPPPHAPFFISTQPGVPT